MQACCACFNETKQCIFFSLGVCCSVTCNVCQCCGLTVCKFQPKEGCLSLLRHFGRRINSKHKAKIISQGNTEQVVNGGSFQAALKATPGEYTDGFDGGRLPHGKDAKWKRPKEFLKASPKLFSEGISPNDIKQGALGDCYLLSALSTLAERGDGLIRSIFLNDEVNEKGCYGLVFYNKGMKHEIVIDDRIPFYGDQPAFSRSSDESELWVMLIEKAFAKLHGSYADIESGIPSVALHALTGAPTNRMPVYGTSSERLWQRMLSARNRGHVMAAGTAPASISYCCPRWFFNPCPFLNLNCNSCASCFEWNCPESSILCRLTDRCVKTTLCLPFACLCGGCQAPLQAASTASTGLSLLHAYSILDVREIKVDGCFCSSTERVIKLRNPWGKGEWSGDWGDNSSRWTSKVKEELNHDNKDNDDGVFWMALDDFMRYFSDVSILYYEPNWKTTTAEVEIEDGNSASFQITITPGGDSKLGDAKEIPCFVFLTHTDYDAHGVLHHGQASRVSVFDSAGRPLGASPAGHYGEVFLPYANVSTREIRVEAGKPILVMAQVLRKTTFRLFVSVYTPGAAQIGLIDPGKFGVNPESIPYAPRESDEEALIGRKCELKSCRRPVVVSEFSTIQGKVYHPICVEKSQYTKTLCCGFVQVEHLQEME
ncbi:hypothetical protein AAMO2058_000271500 [Amorphochlora amoebiformis]